MKSQSLFDQIGGMPAVHIVVTRFYSKVTADDSLRHFFESIDMSAQAQKLNNFVAYALGAPLEYSGKSMQDAHAHMKISDDHFELVANHLVSTLQEIGVRQDLIDQVAEIIMNTKDDIVNQVDA